MSVYVNKLLKKIISTPQNKTKEFQFSVNLKKEEYQAIILHF